MNPTAHSLPAARPSLLPTPRLRIWPCLVAVGVLGCGGHTPASAYMASPGGGDHFAKGTLELGGAHMRAEVCDGVAENKPDATRIDENTLVAFLQKQGFQTSVVRARSNLIYVDVTSSGGDPAVRLRVAVLDDPQAAAQDLHSAILQHGSGSWGVHRSNVAVLAPIGSLDQILEFAGRSKLACWGVLTVSGRDDDFVVPGGYMEF